MEPFDSLFRSSRDCLLCVLSMATIYLTFDEFLNRSPLQYKRNFPAKELSSLSQLTGVFWRSINSKNRALSLQKPDLDFDKTYLTALFRQVSTLVTSFYVVVRVFPQQRSICGPVSKKRDPVKPVEIPKTQKQKDHFLRQAVPVLTLWILNHRNARGFFTPMAVHEIHLAVRQALAIFCRISSETCGWLDICAGSCLAIGLPEEVFSSDPKVNRQKVDYFLGYRSISGEISLTTPLLIQRIIEQSPLSAGTPSSLVYKQQQLSLMLSIARLRDGVEIAPMTAAISCVLIARRNLGITNGISSELMSGLSLSSVQMEAIRIEACFSHLQRN